MTEEKAKSLIGRKVRGFKFEGLNINYDKAMDNYIGKVGVIDCLSNNGNFIVDQISPIVTYNVINNFSGFDEIEIIDQDSKSI